MRANTVKIKNVEYLWKDRIPVGMICLIAGRPGGGKSLLAAHIAAEISKQGTVFLSSAEDPEAEMLVPRLVANKSQLKRIIVGERPSLPDDLPALRKKIIRLNIKLVILDPINVHLADGVRRYNDSIRAATTPMAAIAQETGCSFLLIDHTIKKVSKNTHPLDAIGGASSGIAAASRIAFIVGRDPEDKERVLLACAKTNIREEPDALEFAMDSVEVPELGKDMPILTEVGECEDIDPIMLLVKPSKGKTGRPPSAREKAVEFLVDYLTAAPKYTRSATEVEEDAKQYGITRRTLQTAKKESGVESFKKGKVWFWKLSDDLIEAINASS